MDFYPLFELANCARCLLEDTEMQEHGITKSQIGKPDSSPSGQIIRAHDIFPNDTCYGPLAEHVFLPHLFIVTIRLPFFLYRECGRPLKESMVLLQRRPYSLS